MWTNLRVETVGRLTLQLVELRNGASYDAQAPHWLSSYQLNHDLLIENNIDMATLYLLGFMIT